MASEVEFRQLRTFVAVVDARTLTAAVVAHRPFGDAGPPAKLSPSKRPSRPRREKQMQNRIVRFAGWMSVAIAAACGGQGGQDRQDENSNRGTAVAPKNDESES